MSDSRNEKQQIILFPFYFFFFTESYTDAYKNNVKENSLDAAVSLD